MLKLRIKYGLSPQEPTNEQAKRWRNRVEELLRQGRTAEEAGRRAAQEIFPSYGRYVYEQQADTIYDILQELKK